VLYHSSGAAPRREEGTTVGCALLTACAAGACQPGLLFSIYLSYLQLFEIKAICFWCVISALIKLGIWVAALLDWRQARSGLPGNRTYIAGYVF
jgi:uncharacterized membrane protein